MVSRFRRTPTVQERAAAIDHTNKVAMEATEDERLRREEKSDKLRKLRLAEEASRPSTDLSSSLRAHLK